MDRITRLRVQNVRAIQDAWLVLDPSLTVLIGENGSGKSTYIECLELIRKAPENTFLRQFHSIHRGASGLLAWKARSFCVGVTIEDDRGEEPPLYYEVVIGRGLNGAGAVEEERVQVCVGPKYQGDILLIRSPNQASVWSVAHGALVPIRPDPPDGTALSALGSPPPDPRLARVIAALRGIDVHLPFDTLAAWGTASLRRPSATRTASTLGPPERLQLQGANLASVWHALKNRSQADWQRSLAYVRLGLGAQIDSVNVDVDPSGMASLSLLRADAPRAIPASALSDGQLAWLAFVALVEMQEGRSLLVLDEPELHLHPHLIGGATELLKLAGAPVLIATHADRVLEMLDQPADSVRICCLTDAGGATLTQLDPVDLATWLEEYGDAGALRRDGLLELVRSRVAG